MKHNVMKKLCVALVAGVVSLLALADGLLNLREFIVGEGLNIANLVDGGAAGTDYAASTPPVNVFDGICVSDDSNDRWLGEINKKDTIGTNTYLKLMLPFGYTFKVESYKLWKLSVGGYADDRTPTAWLFYGITPAGEEVLLSEVTDHNAYSSTKDSSFPVTNHVDEVFTGVKFVPTATPCYRYDWMGWDVGLMELEVFVDVVSVPVNLRDFIVGEGLNITNLVDGGVASGSVGGGGQYHPSYPPINAFDGICVSDDANDRWLGEIANGTYLTLMMPRGYTSSIVSYRLCKSSGGDSGYARLRAPMAWEFYGLRTGNEPPVLLSSATNDVTLVSGDVLTIEVTNDMQFVGYKWKPADSRGRWELMRKEEGDENYEGAFKVDWDVGLMELEIVVKNIVVPRKGTVMMFR